MLVRNEVLKPKIGHLKRIFKLFFSLEALLSLDLWGVAQPPSNPLLSKRCISFVFERQLAQQTKNRMIPKQQPAKKIQGSEKTKPKVVVDHKNGASKRRNGKKGEHFQIKSNFFSARNPCWGYYLAGVAPPSATFWTENKLFLCLLDQQMGTVGMKKGNRAEGKKLSE